MGEYVQDGYLGRYINLYYGSFLASARNEDWSEETWQEELYTTLAHELTHHIEGLANAHGLDDKDEEQLLQLLEEFGGSRNPCAPGDTAHFCSPLC